MQGKKAPEAIVIDNVNQHCGVDTSFDLNQHFETSPQQLLSVLYSNAAEKDAEVMYQRLNAASNPESLFQVDEAKKEIKVSLSPDFLSTEHSNGFLAALGQTDAIKFNTVACFDGKLFHSNHYRRENSGVPAIFCNEQFFAKSIEKLEAQKPTATPKGLCRVGIMVAESHLVHMLPELSQHVDVMLLVDYDSLVTQNVLAQLHWLKRTDRPMDFICSYAHPPFNPVCRSNISTKGFRWFDLSSGQQVFKQFKQKTIDHKVLAELFLVHGQELGEFALFDPLQKRAKAVVQQRFEQCKAAAEKIQFVACPGNLMDPKFMAQLRQLLFAPDGERVAEITYMNLSNVIHYDGPYSLIQCLTKNSRWHYGNTFLPNIAQLLQGQHVDPIIFYSTANLENSAQYLVSQMATGFDQFQTACESDIRHALKVWDQQHTKHQLRGKSPEFKRLTIDFQTGQKQKDDEYKAVARHYRTREQKKKGKWPSKTATLVLAVEAGHLEHVKEMIEQHGADATIPNGSGITALEAAKEHEAILAYLESFHQVLVN